MSDLIKKHACSTMTRKFIFMAACAMCDASITDYSLFLNVQQAYVHKMTSEREKIALTTADGVLRLLTNETKLITALEIN